MESANAAGDVCHADPEPDVLRDSAGPMARTHRSWMGTLNLDGVCKRFRYLGFRDLGFLGFRDLG